MEVAAWKVGELARRTGLSVRTLHYYDEVGLLSPSRRSGSGYRLYSPEDVERLQRIKSLRQLGFGLSEVREVLEGANLSPEEILRAHMARLEEEIESRRKIHERLRIIAAKLEAEEEVSAEEFIETIEVIAMSENIEKYYTREQLDYLAKRREEVGEERIKEVGAEWPRLMAEVRAEMERGTPPEDPRARELARRWMGLVEEFTGGDPGIERSLNNVWNEETEIHAMRAADVRGMGEYISKAMAASKENE